MYICLHVKYLLFLSDFSETSIFLTKFLKNAQISNFKKIHPMGAELFCVDRQIDTTKLTVTSCNFVNAPKSGFQRKVKIPNIEVDEPQNWPVQAQRMTLRYLRDVHRQFGHSSPPCVEVVFVNSGLLSLTYLCRGKWWPRLHRHIWTWIWRFLWKEIHNTPWFMGVQQSGRISGVYQDKLCSLWKTSSR
jgi:hypothetical protein